MIKEPKFITFTGADDLTPIVGMIELSEQYPIEWGILFSPKRQGQGRYPTTGQIGRFCRESRSLRLSAHICGGHSRELMETGDLPILNEIIEGSFARVQVNTSSPTIQPYRISEWASNLGARAIMQCRGGFPMEGCVDWLFDTSGGRGQVPSGWPTPVTINLCGYAGGLRPENVAEHVAAIGRVSDNYWIDMETGVRDADDRFDLDLCRKVCEAVFPREDA